MRRIRDILKWAAGGAVCTRRLESFFSHRFLSEHHAAVTKTRNLQPVFPRDQQDYLIDAACRRYPVAYEGGG
jgi:hypothetical protein